MNDNRNRREHQREANASALAGERPRKMPFSAALNGIRRTARQSDQALAAFFGAALRTAGFLAAGFLAVGFLPPPAFFAGAAFFATGFFAAGFLAAGLVAAGFLAVAIFEPP